MLLKIYTHNTNICIYKCTFFVELLFVVVEHLLEGDAGLDIHRHARIVEYALLDVVARQHQVVHRLELHLGERLEHPATLRTYIYMSVLFYFVQLCHSTVCVSVCVWLTRARRKPN